MNTCQKCGNILPVEANFCNVCGEKIIHKIFCTNCGRELKEERFCPDCGTLSPTLRTFNSNQTQQCIGMSQGTYQAQQCNYTMPKTNNSSHIKIDRVLPIMRNFTALSLTIFGTLSAICFTISSIYTIAEDDDIWWLPVCSSILIALCLNSVFSKLGKAMDYIELPTARIIKSIGVLLLVANIFQGISYIGYIDYEFHFFIFVCPIVSGICLFVVFIMSIIQLVKLWNEKYNGRILYPAIIMLLYPVIFAILGLFIINLAKVAIIIMLILQVLFIYAILHFTTKLISTSDEDELVEI